MTAAELRQAIAERWPSGVRVAADAGHGETVVACGLGVLPQLCARLFLDWKCAFGGLIVEEGAAAWHLRYVFYGAHEVGWIHVTATIPLEQRVIPSIVKFVHAADWHEREAEDLFGLQFEGHPRLGDFVLHDDAWQEGVEPMRRGFSAHTPVSVRRPNTEWRPHRVFEASGAFVMPIGPVFSGVAESAHFLLETVGEDVVRALPRLFYKYRGIEKIAEGRSVPDVLLLAERFAANTAFAHALAFCQAVEAIGGAQVPIRARLLRVLLAELERIRHHIGAIEGICESTALVVAASQFAMLEEEVLRISGALLGHRYLFGVVTPGGLTADLEDAACRDAVHQCRAVLQKLDDLDRMLRVSSSFLDRLEQVGYIRGRDAEVFGLVGPIARGSGVSRDLRYVSPYAAYDALTVEVVTEREGDGYARLRVLFREARVALALMQQAVDRLMPGPVSSVVDPRPGAALGWVEAPRGAALHWIRLDADGHVDRYRIMPPSFANWLGFRLGVEDFAYQDFPIILSTLDLSVSENDR